MYVHIHKINNIFFDKCIYLCNLYVEIFIIWSQKSTRKKNKRNNLCSPAVQNKKYFNQNDNNLNIVVTNYDKFTFISSRLIINCVL